MITVVVGMWIAKLSFALEALRAAFCVKSTLLRSLLSTEPDVLVIAQVLAINALVLSSLCEYRHKSWTLYC